MSRGTKRKGCASFSDSVDEKEGSMMFSKKSYSQDGPSSLFESPLRSWNQASSLI